MNRMARGLLLLAAIASVANGLVMIFAPMQWYGVLPSVQATGPANMHLIVDVGIAYFSSGVFLMRGALSRPFRAGAAIAGLLWLAAHGLFHVIEVLTGSAPLSRFWVDAPAVVGLPLTVILALGILGANRRSRAASNKSAGPLNY